MNPTINDVARRAKTSKSTVSRFLNGYTVKKETEEALKKAIRELNYYPNINARRLVNNRTQVIGIVVDDISNNFYAGIFSGIEKVAQQNGYQCVYYSGTSNLQGGLGFLNLAHEKQVDGLIHISFLTRSDEFMERMKELTIPMILVGDGGDKKDIEHITSVDIDNKQGIKEVVYYLHRIGHRKIAFIAGPEDFSATIYRRKGYMDALKELRLEYNPKWTVPSDWSKESGYKAMRDLLDIGGFTAVIASNDETAIGALLCIHELGYIVPKDCSIVGFDDIEVSKWVYPPLTTVKQPLPLIGEKVTEELIKQLKEKTTQKERILIEPKLIVRNSCMNLK